MSLYRRPKNTAFNYDDAFQARVREAGSDDGGPAGPATPAIHIRHYSSGATSDEPGAFRKGGIKHWSQAPWKGPGEDPRGFKHHDTDGIPITTSRAEIDHVLARTRDHNTPLAWERD